jgi:hypothetical protein
VGLPTSLFDAPVRVQAKMRWEVGSPEWIRADDAETALTATQEYVGLHTSIEAQKVGLCGSVGWFICWCVCLLGLCN